MPAAVTQAEMRCGVGVLALGGCLCAQARQSCLTGLSVLLRRRPRTIVLDLSGTTVGPGAVDLVGVLRRHAEHLGAVVWLAAVPAELAAQFALDGTEHRVMPTADVAVQFLHAGDPGVSSPRG